MFFPDTSGARTTIFSCSLEAQTTRKSLYENNTASIVSRDPQYEKEYHRSPPEPSEAFGAHIRPTPMPKKADAKTPPEINPAAFLN
ncbi:MAG: hypothetical protein H7067_02905 [Burkholderiales bacterium]|nr:hypothetical protein [Opitutaceae bacterium]